MSAQIRIDYIAGTSLDLNELQVEFDSREQFELYIQEVCEKKRADGYLSFSVDSIVKNRDTFKAYMYEGKRFDIAFDKVERRKILDELERLEDSGHPFARVEIESSVDSTRLESKPVIFIGPEILFDSLVLLQSPSLPSRILGIHLGIRSGMPYAEKLVDKADSRLRMLPFIRVVRPTSVIFTKEKARVLLALEKRNANQVDGIVGFQPDSEGDISFTGELKLDLHNSFSHLDNIFLKWQRVADNTQDIEFKIRYPYLFSSSIGIRAGIDQYRQDTTFNQVKLTAGLFSVLDNGSELSVFFESQNVNNLLGQDDVAGRNTSLAQYGLTYDLNGLNDLFNPTNGIRMMSRVSYGDKEVRQTAENGTLQNVDQWTVGLRLEKFIALKKRSTLLFRLSGLHNESDVIIFNELERIGGIHTLRGTDEQSIRASSYSLFTAEYRFITDERSFFSGFVDYGWYEQDADSGYIRDNPLGIG
ncbi:MAG: BamA/TamA family outer membrane protein, partial [Flavobacteriales bacterium]|nr:BamA/TamA family outer membrane protein [Flavobacteriales bacterium]